MQVPWIKCGVQWCPLETVVLDDVNTEGVYIIWHNISAKVIYVGQGNIRERLLAHRRDSKILAHRGDGLLLVTWTPIPDLQDRLGIERFLTRKYTPLNSSQFSFETTQGIAVNGPGE